MAAWARRSASSWSPLTWASWAWVMSWAASGVVAAKAGTAATSPSSKIGIESPFMEGSVTQLSRPGPCVRSGSPTSNYQTQPGAVKAVGAGFGRAGAEILAQTGYGRTVPDGVPPGKAGVAGQEGG